jgi:signal-transduction protein with cAMP-binding, CBS, and nucleotidyltransferase domain
LVGTLTDGDIRSGFLKGLNINSSVKSIVNKNPIIIKKTETKEKLLKIALSNKIHQIPVVDKNDKVIGIHIIEELITPKDKSNKVVIMAGGRGMRLRPLTKNIPKPMLKVGNKPILQTIVEKFKESGYENFVICVNYKSKIIKNYFGVKINYIQEKTRMGTAGALSLFQKKPNKLFL